MPDIAVCAGHGCPIRNSCYRFRAVPDPLGQYYEAYWRPLRPGGKCPGYEPIKEGDELRPLEEDR